MKFANSVPSIGCVAMTEQEGQARIIPTFGILTIPLIQLIIN